MSRKGILMILDGYGEGKSGPYNAVKNANTPTLNELKKNSYSLLKTDSEAVGLFNGELGGSEVGHTTIGAGRIVPSTAKKIHDDIKIGIFQKNNKLLNKRDKLKATHGNLHLIGLMSDKNIHSDINHAYEILKMFNKYAKNIFIHFITDGRDSGGEDSLKYLKELQKCIKNMTNVEIASVMGRFYAMDRENNMDRTDLAVHTMFNLDKIISNIKSNEIENYLKKEHLSGNTDEYINPIHIDTKQSSELKKDDLIFFFNFREDRLRQIVMKTYELSHNIITMSSVSTAKTTVLYQPKIVKNTLSEYLSKQGKKQIKISETTKYAHVTYFFNGGREEPFENEDRVHIPTIKVDNFSKTPKMRAGEITKEIIKAMDKNYDAIIVNYSNPDMLGHTGNYEATVEALEELDRCVKKVVEYAKKTGYFLLITADHGNSEMMRTISGEPHTAHTFNRVFCLAVEKDKKYKFKKYGELKDVAPTFLNLLQLKPNKSFTGKSLLL